MFFFWSWSDWKELLQETFSVRNILFLKITSILILKVNHKLLIWLQKEKNVLSSLLDTKYNINDKWECDRTGYGENRNQKQSKK